MPHGLHKIHTANGGITLGKRLHVERAPKSLRVPIVSRTSCNRPSSARAESLRNIVHSRAVYRRHSRVTHGFSWGAENTQRLGRVAARFDVAMCGCGNQRQLNVCGPARRSRMCWSTASSWKKNLVGNYSPRRTSITSTAFVTTIDLKTWNFGQNPSQPDKGLVNRLIAPPVLARVGS